MTHNTGKKRERERGSMGVAAVPLTCRLSVSMRLQANSWLHLFKCKRGSKGAGKREWVQRLSADSSRNEWVFGICLFVHVAHGGDSLWQHMQSGNKCGLMMLQTRCVSLTCWTLCRCYWEGKGYTMAAYFYTEYRFTRCVISTSNNTGLASCSAISDQSLKAVCQMCILLKIHQIIHFNCSLKQVWDADLNMELSINRQVWLELTCLELTF